MAISGKFLKRMNGARPSDGLLPASATMALLDLLARRDAGATPEQLIRDLVASTPMSWARALNTVAKLQLYDLISRAPSGRISAVTVPRRDAHAHIADSVAAEVIRRLSDADAWSCLRYDVSNGGLVVDSMTLPKMNDGLAVWVTEFGVAARSQVAARYWHVAEAHRETFLTAVQRSNDVRPRRAKSAERLAAELAQQAQDGEAAELWVLSFERQRLRDHPFCDQVRRVSPDDVSAGYDIASFAGAQSLRHDLFIEVKSHGARKAFHWSRNEIATALAFREEYALYLVDRSCMGEPGYSPHIILAPSPEIFAQQDSGWTVEATSFEHVAVID